MQSMKYLRTTILILLLFAGACDDRGGEFIDDDQAISCRTRIKKDACGTTDIGNNRLIFRFGRQRLFYLELSASDPCQVIASA